jgi:hypothetical protein
LSAKYGKTASGSEGGRPHGEDPSARAASSPRPLRPLTPFGGGPPSRRPPPTSVSGARPEARESIDTPVHGTLPPPPLDELLRPTAPPPALAASAPQPPPHPAGAAPWTPPSVAPVVRWTTPTRRPIAPRAVERAARPVPPAPPLAAAPSEALERSTAITAIPPPPPRGSSYADVLEEQLLAEAALAPPSTRLFAEAASTARFAEDLRRTVPAPAAGPTGTLRPPALGAPEAARSAPTVVPPALAARAEARALLPVAPAADANPASLPPKTSGPPHVSNAHSVAPAILSVPPLADVRAERSWRRVPWRWLGPLVATYAVLGLAGLVLIAAARPPRLVAPRGARLGVVDRSPLAPAALPPSPSPPSGGCAASGVTRVLAPRAQIGAGLDVSVLENGFGVGLASGVGEALGLRVDGARLGIAESVRVRVPAFVSHVAVDRSHDEDGAGLDVRVDSGDLRTVVGSGDGSAFRVAARGGTVMAFVDEPRGPRYRILWSLPPAARQPYRSPSGRHDPRATAAIPDSLRTAARDEGGVVVAVRRAAVLWVGVADGSFKAAGPLVPVVRKGATLGTPAVTAWGGGGAVAWAEKGPLDRDWKILVAGFTPDGEGATHLGPARTIGQGMSPALASFPDGDLLLVYAEGGAGAHRIVATRLDRDLAPRAEPLVLSDDAVNAGQPVAAVGPDGRVLVAFFAAERGRSLAVHATPLACDPGL